MIDQPRPLTHSLGNSLTSISSLTTLPPSPMIRTRPTRSAEVVGSSDKKPSDVHVDPLNLLTPARSPDEPVTPLGSVPSPRPKFAHLVSSAPSRPRLSRPHSSPGDARARIPSPLNPARQLQKPAASSGGVAFNLDTGSVPQPRPNRLFTSLLGLPMQARPATDPKLPPTPKLTRRPPRLTNDQKGSAPRKISPPRTGAGGPARRIPMLTVGLHSDPTSTEGQSSAEAGTLVRPPNSFSTFVAVTTSLK